MSHDTSDPFSNKKAPRLTWKELFFLGGIVASAVTAWATTRSELTDQHRQLEELRRRQDKSEEALIAIPAMQRDLSWIRSWMENQDRRRAP